MVLRYYANAPATTLAASVTIAGTSILVASVAGLPIQYPYTLILDRGTATEEAVSVTAASGTTLTITRAIDGTTAFAHNVGGTVEHGITAQDVREPNSHINANSSVHGVTGSVVGTTDTQALTNKDLTSGTNTFPASLATDTEVATVQTSVNNHIADTGIHVPVGVVLPWAGTPPAPTGWFHCNGQAISRTTYSALFGVIGTTFGVGDGSTTFNVPNLQGRLPLGVNGSHPLGALEGSETKTLTTANLPSHLHSMAHTHAIDHNHASFSTSSDGAHQHALSRSAGAGGGTNNIPKGDAFNDSNVAGLASDGAHTHTVDVPAFVGSSGASSAANTGSTGSGTAFDIMPPTIGLNYIIRAL